MMKSECQPAGLCLAVLGSDGAGKSTLLVRLQELLRTGFFQNSFVDDSFSAGGVEEKKTGVVIGPLCTDARRRNIHSAELAEGGILFFR